jgi:hypothetical protein
MGKQISTAENAKGRRGWLIVLKHCVPAAPPAVSHPPQSGEIRCRLINNVSRHEKAIRVMLLEFADWAPGSASEHGKMFLRFVAGFSMLVIDKS